MQPVVLLEHGSVAVAFATISEHETAGPIGVGVPSEATQASSRVENVDRYSIAQSELHRWLIRITFVWLRELYHMLYRTLPILIVCET